MTKRKKISPELTPTGSYRVRWSQEGKRECLTFLKKVEAVAFCRDLNNGIFPSKKVNEGPTPLPSEALEKHELVEKFSDLSQKFMDLHVKVKRKPSTIRSYNMYLKHHILPVLKDVYINDLHITHLDKLNAVLCTKERQNGRWNRNVLTVNKAVSEPVKLSEKMIREVLCLTLTIAKYGYERDFLEKNPFKLFKLQKLSGKKTEYWNGAEVEKFLAWCDAGGPYEGLAKGRYSPGRRPKTTLYTENIKRDAEIFRFALHSGARLGEIKGLKRKAIDYQNRLIWISEIFDGTAKELAERTKGGGQVRCVEMDNVTFEILKKREFESPESLIFDIPDKPLWEYAFFIYCNRAGVSSISFHGLRHTFATAMALCTPPAVLQKILGHESWATTMKYVHIAKSESLGFTKFLKALYKGHRDVEILRELTLEAAC